MKDIIENRVRLKGSTKARLLAMSLKENGLLWTGLIGIYYTASAVGEKAFSIAARRRTKLGLPGMNSVAINRLIWEKWDWSGQGEEWSPSARRVARTVAGTTRAPCLFARRWGEPITAKTRVLTPAPERASGRRGPDSQGSN